MPDQVYGVSLNGVEKQSYSFDNLGRLTNKVVNVSAGKNITYSYAYKNVGDNGTTTVVETFTNACGTYEYEYDGNGNITKETFTPSNPGESAKATIYSYDSLGQLTLVNINGDNRYAYRYDASGNIVSVGYIEADAYYPTNYTYGNVNWRDQLTNFNGEAITYDEIGNPLVYRGAKLSWSNGRQLAKYQKGSMIAEYKYDGNGNRISKSHNGNTYEFIYNGSNLVAMTNTGTTLFNWICDENGDYLGFTYCGVEYYYIRNLQNDVIGIKNPSGKVVVKYEYDPFGKVIATKGLLADTLGKLNPIRYRGYFYDTETGFYFLKSRYYDPETCRFINADGLVSTGQGILGYNMYAYCGNNPVNRVDSTGQLWSEICNFVNTVVAEIGKAMGVMSPIYAGCGAAAMGDGPLPAGDIAGLTVAVLATVGAVGYGIYQATQATTIAVPKVDEKAEVIPAPPPSETVIYRYYSSKTENLSPRPGIDYDGLSFSTKPPRPGVPAVVTTIEQVNATGVLTAIPTGGTHVTIIPTNGTVVQWMSQGNFSIWTQTLSSIVVEWDGGF